MSTHTPTLLLLLMVIPSILTQSTPAPPDVWLSCPTSFNPDLPRTGSFTGPCEPESTNGRTATPVKAGDRLKVGWVSGNNAGGYVRLALVPDSQATNETAFDNSVLKATCFGTDERAGRSAFGSCVHPCNGRSGCQWQANETDTERYDTGITIPYNLADGSYVLQMVALAGNAAAPVYSCALLQVTGGDSGLTCLAPDNIPESQGCVTATGPSIDTILANVNATAGQFCFSPSGTGSIDDDIATQPINYDCDPRVGCSISVNQPLCQREVTGISDTANPVQVCSVTGTLPGGATATETASCIDNGVITQPDAFCAEWTQTCDSTCAANNLGPSTLDLCRTDATQPFGLALSCQCGGQDQTNPVINALIPGACVPTQTVADATITPATTTKTRTTKTHTSKTRKSRTTKSKTKKSKCPKTKTTKTKTTKTKTTKTKTTNTRSTRTSKTTIPTPTPTCPPTIPDGSKCNPKKDKATCSGRNFVECVRVLNSAGTRYIGEWQTRNCSTGTACVFTNTRGGFTCDFDYKSSCPLPVAA
ncbi:hypothetical protein HK104_001960 [Borealophlyctis nickersoniae]|nr:hypothetical protein HK104_001960 [Borealophlyctis nickersoniae]